MAEQEPPAGEPGDVSVEELLKQIRGIPVGQFLLSTVSTLAALIGGKLDTGELDQARLGIEAIGALLPVLEGQLDPDTKRELEAALANLQLAYAEAVKRP